MYYAGAGYLLVVPDLRLKEKMSWPPSCCSSNNWSIKLRRDMASQTEHQPPPVLPSQTSQPRLTCWTGEKTDSPAVESGRSGQGQRVNIQTHGVVASRQTQMRAFRLQVLHLTIPTRPV